MPAVGFSNRGSLNSALTWSARRLHSLSSRMGKECRHSSPGVVDVARALPGWQEIYPSRCGARQEDSPVALSTASSMTKCWAPLSVFRATRRIRPSKPKSLWKGSLADRSRGGVRRHSPLFAATVASSSADATAGCVSACDVPPCSPPRRHAGGVPSATRLCPGQTCPLASS